jgi:hypothetical protein
LVTAQDQRDLRTAFVMKIQNISKPLPLNQAGWKIQIAPQSGRPSAKYACARWTMFRGKIKVREVERTLPGHIRWSSTSGRRRARRIERGRPRVVRSVGRGLGWKVMGVRMGDTGLLGRRLDCRSRR